MRSIDDIIQELTEHPEYVHHEIWTKAGVRDYIANDFSLDETGADRLAEILTDEDYSDFEDFIYNVYEFGFGDTHYDYTPELETRIKRHIKLDDLLGEPDDYYDDDLS
jgi:deoxyhypusine synthase